MALTDLTSGHIQEILALVKQKEALQMELARVDAALTALESGTSETVPVKGNKRTRRKGQPLKVVILEALKGAGKAGMSVDELAQHTGRKKGSISVWFYTSAKKIKKIKKVGRGRFAIG